MPKGRLIFFFLTLAIVGIAGAFVALYARGYRLDRENLSLEPNGLFVIKSHPDGAQVFINGVLEAATNANLDLPPNTYDVNVRKEGYRDWNKRMVIEKEIVTETTAHLFKSAPSLSAITFSGATNTTASYDLRKIAYFVKDETSNGSDSKTGIWILETLNLPLGFSRDPRQITDADFSDATLRWSPNGREILLTANTSTFLLDATKLTPQTQLINVANTEEEIIEEWDKEQEKKDNAQLRKLPDKLISIFERKVDSFVFSPDEDMVLYTANGDENIPDNLIKQLPGSSTQRQNRNIKTHHSYVYDIKEDRNFLIDIDSADLTILGGRSSMATRRLSWFSTSRHLVLSQKDKVTIMDYDATNKKEVYAGSLVAPNAYPTLSLDRLIILTNLGAESSPTNLYSLGLK